MTNTATLTHQDAYKNIKVLEEFESLPKKEVYGFGVDGKRFKLMKMTDNFFSRIWFSILKFLKFVKADDKSIKNLKQYTIDHIDCNDYKKWSKTNCKVSKQGIKNLMDKNAELEKQVSTNKTKNSESEKAKGTLQDEVTTKQSTINDLQLEIAKVRSELATANADKLQLETDKEELEKAVKEKEEKNTGLTEEVGKQKKRVDKYKKRCKKHEEDKAYLLTAWQHINPEKSFRKYLKENKLYETVHDQFHKPKVSSPQ